MHLSHDGSRLVVPTMDAQAFDVAPGKIDAYVREHHLSSYLRVFDISTGEKVPAWISHVQFSPDVALDRQGTPSTAHGGREPQQGRLDRHEMWERDGKSIIYHGTYVDGRAHLGRVKRPAIPVRKAVERGFRCSTSTGTPARSTGIRSATTDPPGNPRTSIRIPSSTTPATPCISPQTCPANARAIAWMSPMCWQQPGDCSHVTQNNGAFGILNENGEPGAWD